ncbi:sulfotransferase family 2 domain-containing protein [Microcoleus sp. T3_B1]|uniref:sulfotransferase family 2 domain-containing protein n=1 Tax=Microcoleus sp. T3_B1 TaxID=3055425 RepID=UPI002FD61AD2
MNTEKLEKIKADLERSRSWLQQVQAELKVSQQETQYSLLKIPKSSVEIISVHVPKTAGSFFNSVLQQVYEKDLFNDYKEQIHAVLFHVLKTIPQAKSELINNLISANIKAIHGHFPIAKYEGYFPKAKRIVWLRNPIKRIISTYYFILGEPATWANDRINKSIAEFNLDIYDFVELPAMQNQISNYYCRGRELSEFDFVGIHEYLNEDIIELKHLMKWPDFTSQRVNDNKYPNYQDHLSTLMNDRKLIEKISLLNKEDMHLYELALKLRETRRQY